MSQSEPKLITKLLSANATTQRLVISDLDPSYFRVCESEARFIWEFYEDFDKVPSIQTLRSEFPSFRPKRPEEPVDFYIKSIKATKINEKINRDIGPILRNIQDGKDPFLISEKIKGLAESLDSGHSKTSGVRKWSDSSDKMQRYRRREEGSITSFRFPIKGLRTYIERMYPQELLTLSASPASGKTWIAVWFAMSAALDQSLRTGLVTREISDEDISDRLDVLYAGLSWTRFRRGQLTLKEKSRYKIALQEIEKKNPYLDILGAKERQYTLDDIAAYIEKHSLDFIIVDGMHLIDPAKGSYAKSTVEKTYDRSRQFKSLLKSLDCIGMQVIHSNANDDDEDGIVDTVSGLSGANWGKAYSQDSDVFMEMLVPSGKRAPERTLVILKTRNEGTGKVDFNMHFDDKLEFTENMRSGLYIEVDLDDG